MAAPMPRDDPVTSATWPSSRFPIGKIFAQPRLSRLSQGAFLLDLASLTKLDLAVKFSELAASLDQMEATSSRNELVRLLFRVCRFCSVKELEPITYLIQGRLSPFFEPVEIGLGERLLITAIAAAYSVPKEEVTRLNRQTGDLGVTAQRIATASPNKSPSVVEVHRRLSEIAAAGGAGSQQEKLDGFTGLLGDLDATSAKHLVRITLGKMRLGIGDPTVLDALS